MDALRRSLSVDPDRKYQLIPMTTIRMFAESRGYVISDDVLKVLTEDVNYRLREIVSESAQYMKRSSHSCLKVSDVNHALTDANLPRIYPGTEANNVYIPSQKIYAPEDLNLDLEAAVVQDVPVELSAPFQHEVITLYPTYTAPADAATNHAVSNYFTVITKAAAGADAQLKKVALADVTTNPRVGHMQVQLLVFVQKWVVSAIKVKDSVHSALELLDSLTNNQTLNFTPQLALITELIVNRICLSSWQDDKCRQLSDQQYAADILAKCLKCDNVTSKQTKATILTRCEGILYTVTEAVSYRQLIGALVLIRSLAALSLVKLTANVNKILSFLSTQTSMESLIVQSLLIDCFNKILDVADSSLSADNTNEILTLAEILRLHLPSELACRVIVSSEREEPKTARRGLKYLRRTASGRVCKSQRQHDEYFRQFQAIQSHSTITIAYGRVKDVSQPHRASVRVTSSERKLSIGHSRPLYDRFEASRQSKVNARSSTKVCLPESILNMTL